MSLKLKYGLNFTASDAANALEQNSALQNGVRSWRQLFGNAGIAYEGQKSALQSDYASAIAEAYRSNLRTRDAIYRTGLSAGGMTDALRTSDAALVAAYNTYLQKYAQDVTALDQAYAQEIGAYTDELRGQGKNVSNLLSNAYRYWADELSGAYRMRDTTDAAMVGEGMNAELGEGVVQTEERLADLYDMNAWYNLNEAGERESLKTWEELATVLINPDGTINKAGRKFFDQIFGIKPEGFTTTNDKGEEHTTRNFAQWLSDTNPDLYTWAMSADNANYTRAGTNLGTTKKLLGLESTDADYTDYEHADWSKLDDFDVSSQDVKAAFEESVKAASNDVGFGASTLAMTDAMTNDFAPMPMSTLKTAEDNANAQIRAKYGEFITESATSLQEMNDYALRNLGQERYTRFRTEYANDIERIENTLDELAKASVSVDMGSKAFDDLLTRVSSNLREYKKLLKKFIADNPKPKASGY